MKMILKEKYNCSGCSACYSICPVNAINMIEDEEGFLYPQINNNKCINCKLCSVVCKKQEIPHKNKNINVYAVKHKDSVVRMCSQSGGAFTALTDLVLKNGGICYGVKLDDEFTAVHSRISTISQRDECRGSKYIQSRIGNVYKQVKQDLDMGYTIMFVGTACQISGLKVYLGEHKNLANIILVDLICYSVASPLIWKEYINFLKEKYKSDVKKVNFRNKRFGWKSCIETISFEFGEMSFKYFARIFGRRLATRPSCFSCKFTSVDRVSDITIGDYWGIEDYIPDFKDSKGVSLVLINTQKGRNVFENIRADIDVKEIPIGKALQPALVNSQIEPLEREMFWYDYRSNDFVYILRKYAGYTWMDRLKTFIRNYIYRLKG